jgi:hypothetical protein
MDSWFGGLQKGFEAATKQAQEAAAKASILAQQATAQAKIYADQATEKAKVLPLGAAGKISTSLHGPDTILPLLSQVLAKQAAEEAQAQMAHMKAAASQQPAGPDPSQASESSQHHSPCSFLHAASSMQARHPHGFHACVCAGPHLLWDHR